MAHKPSQSLFRVRYQETDQMRVAWHGNYITWFEVARTDWLRAHGYEYADLERRGFFLPVLRVQCEYRRVARYNDELSVETDIVEYNGVRFTFAYEVSKVGEPGVLARGQSEHVFTDASLRPVRMARRLPELDALLQPWQS
jgi:acyl-CoA thioester hydrolase